jgi:2-phosphosulfolactate phosphatase
MEIRTFFTINELKDCAEVADSLIVFDIFGASTMITAALQYGALRAVPLGRLAEGIKLKEILGQENVILCGENSGKPIKEFDMGNSPTSLRAAGVQDKLFAYLSQELVETADMSGQTPNIWLGCFNNIRAITLNVIEQKIIHIVCLGKGEKLSFEDAVCAGMLIDLLWKTNPDEQGLSDNASTARFLFGRHVNDIFGLLKESARGQKLVAGNRQKDLEYIAQIGLTNVIPQLASDRTHFSVANSLNI